MTQSDHAPEGRRLMKGFRWFVGIAASVFVFGLGTGGILGGRWLVSSLSELPTEVLAALIGSIATILVGIFGVLWNQRSLQRRQIREAHREPKREVYTEFVDKIIIDTLTRSGQLKDPRIQKKATEELAKTYQNFVGKLMVWGSPGFMKAFRDFKEAGAQGDYGVLLYVDDMIREMRADLGHDDRGLARGDVIKLLLNDPQEIDRLLAKGGRDSS